jgi:hypothetical protein
MDRIASAGIDVRTTIDADRTEVFAWERWIDHVLICRIPGSGRGVPEKERK